MTSASAFWIAAVRARETGRGAPLFIDPFAHDLAGDYGYATMAASERVAGGENAFIPVRVRWFDDLTMTSAAAGVRQIVLLGAGLDTRAYRLDLPADADWYEVDRREIFQHKEPVLAEHSPRCQRHIVIADLGGDWAEPLLHAGLDPAARTLWLAEGLFFYLTEPMIVDLLHTAAALCGPASIVAADIIGTAGLDAAAMRGYRDWCDRNGVPPPFGADDPAALLHAGGWRAEHITTPGAADANYGRLPIQPGGRQPGRTHLVTASLATS
ncbi:class I SAM-dependent methyltransferase [Dactylosporangium matsuzakiense]|uniref:S-adenosyl-L-methionine-dependent methyltransferase n=1 Tax=Dactylosporangium matsuzakiense TaxID=53360 RepID=A0A9W6NK46_9ACTN|nr:SAM-dependent methyltransferase [Dactylosporangium matsuzakiense]GLK99351.1 S-adenosyl-L-methionine-dependent methyltransferase [Dactylosporangium matsuzakiense]